MLQQHQDTRIDNYPIPYLVQHLNRYTPHIPIQFRRAHRSLSVATLLRKERAYLLLRLINDSGPFESVKPFVVTVLLFCLVDQ